jgi:hypothetical protein
MERQMKRERCVVLVMVFSAAIVATADAQSLKVRERMLDQESELIHDAKSTQRECEANFPIAFDWTSAPEDKLESFSQEAYCDAALTALRRLCGDKLGKKAVQDKIKKVTCGFGTERAVSLKDGALEFKMSYPSTDNADFVYKYLENNL